MCLLVLIHEVRLEICCTCILVVTELMKFQVKAFYCMVMEVMIFLDCMVVIQVMAFLDCMVIQVMAFYCMVMVFLLYGDGGDDIS